MATSGELVRQLLASQFPEWTDLPVERYPSSGTVNTIYRLGPDLAVRLPLNETGVRHLERERSWLGFLGPNLPLVTPESVGEGDPELDYPLPWSVHRWIPGRPWALDGIHEPTEAARALAEFIGALRSVDAEGGPAGRPADRGRRLADRDGMVDRALGQLGDEIDVSAARAIWQHSASAPEWDGPPTWFHGDLLPGNVLTTNGQLHAVIDFGGIGVGDPACDLAPAWTLFTGESRDAFRSALHPDEASWRRGRGWALSIALLILPYYRESNPAMAEMARRTITEVLAERE